MEILIICVPRGGPGTTSDMNNYPGVKRVNKREKIMTNEKTSFLVPETSMNNYHVGPCAELKIW